MANKKYLNYEGLQELVLKVKELVRDIGHFVFKGVVSTVSGLPSLTDVQEGWVYAVSTTGTTTEDFVEGAGHPVPANSEVIATEVSGEMKWALLGPIFDISDRLQFGTQMPGTPFDGQTFLYTGDTTYVAYTGTLTKDSNPKALGLYEESSQDVYVLTNDTEPKAVYKAWSDGTDDYFTLSATPSVGDTVYTIDDGTATDSGYTVEAYDATTGITVNSTEYARATAKDSYIAEQVYYQEQYQQGVIYVYDETATSWQALSQGDTFVPITSQEVDALFQ